jgi:beta-1,4-mannooligosaccharide/beta-1,4-mannosyl-N-acetylglucosamine phosphorylase
MSQSIKIVGPELPNIPWQPRTRTTQGPVWRFDHNPIIPRDLIPTSNSIFNSAAVSFEGKFAGVFRCDDITRKMVLHAGRSEDGFQWDIAHETIKWMLDDVEVEEPTYAYDPRVCWLEDRYYVTWCNGWHGPTIGLGWTKDFKEFRMVENLLLPYNRNGVLFPRKVNGRYLMFSRPSDTGHTAFGDIYLSQSEDLVYWGRHRYVMGPKQSWESTKVGAGPVPLETSEGWLLFHHGVLTSCNGYVYSFGAVLLDLEKPWQVRYRCKPYLINPRELYELTGDVPNVCFPCATLADAPSGKITIYYGCADTVTGLAFTQIDELFEYIKKNSD